MTDNDTARAPWIDYDYALVRVVPSVHLGAFMNVGVVMQARTRGFLAARCALDAARLAALAPELDLALLERYLAAYCRVCEGGVDAGPIGLLPASERFHWLTAPRSAIVQTSPVHPGRCRDLAAEMDRLFRTVAQGGGQSMVDSQ
jgi:hypothetical protein